MRFRIPTLTIVLLVAVLILVSACRPADPGAQPTATTAPPDTPLPATETAPPEIEPTPTTEATPTLEVSEPMPDLEPLRQELATRLGVPVEDVAVDATELLGSADLCLGVYDGGNCYLVTLQVSGETYAFHVNNAGAFTDAPGSPPAQPGQIVLTYGRDDCQVAALRLDTPQVGLGPCRSEFSSFDFGGDPAATQAELEELLSEFAPFTATTTLGFLSFGGSGSTVADTQQQEDIAAWMRRVVDDAVAAGPSDDALCTHLTRPALVVMSQSQLAVTNPFTGEQCQLNLPGEYRGALQAGGGFIYFVDSDGPDTLIREMSSDGTLRPLDVTRINSSERNLLGFVVSPDGRYVAWSTAVGVGPGMTSSLYVAETSADTAQTIVSDLVQEDGRGLIPVRFDGDSQTLVYTLQPIGLGGAWPSFVGRYDSLFTVPASGGEGQQHFDCPEQGLFLCIGDFVIEGGELQAIAYVRENTVEIVDGQGTSINSVPMDDEYVAYPTFSPGGDLVFYTATLGEGESGFPFAEPGAYYRLAAPYDGEPALIAEQDGLLTPYQWFDAQHLIIGLGDVQGNWGTGLLGMDGSVTRLEPWPATQAITVIR